MSVIKVNTDNFDAEVLASEKTVLVDFYADWCGPCRMVSPIVDQIAQEHPEYKVVKVNVDDDSALAIRFGIMTIPSLFVFKGGEIGPRDDKIGVTHRLVIFDGVHNDGGAKLGVHRMRARDRKTVFVKHGAHVLGALVKEARKFDGGIAKLCDLLESFRHILLHRVAYAVKLNAVIVFHKKALSLS